MNLVILCLALVTAVPDGSIVALRNDKGIVHRVTKSTITHTGMVFNHDGVPWVYDAYPPKVRAMPLYQYVGWVRKQRETSPDEELWLLRPKENYSSAQVLRMLQYAQSQLGRPYGVRAYVFDKPKPQIHCSWYTMETLARSGRYVSPEPWKVTPGELLEAVTPNHFPPEKVILGEPHEPQRLPR